jgi:hypothetical protein
LNLKKIENICAAAIVVAFFLPWISIGGMFSFSGYSIPAMADMASTLESAFAAGNETEASSVSVLVYAVYLVPLLAIGILLIEYLGNNAKMLCLGAGALNIAGFIYLLVVMEGAVSAIGIGLWLTALASVVMLLGASGVIKMNSES